MNYYVKKTIEEYFINNWDKTPIQFEGVNLDISGLDELIALSYVPTDSRAYALDGTSCGRIVYSALQKVFCYSKSPSLAFKLADEVKAFLNGKKIDGIVFGVGYDSGAEELDNDFFRVLCNFPLKKWV